MQKSIKNNEILFIVHTHGNEPAPFQAIQNVIKHKGREYFDAHADFVVANPIATEKNVRFIDADLNRIYPGNINSLLYEERRAVEVLEIAKKYKYVIDIHTTVSDSGIFTIVSKPTQNNLKLAKQLSLDKIVIWESTSGRPTGPITSYLENAVGIECSTYYERYMRDLEGAISDTIDVLSEHKTFNAPKEIYKVIGSISSDTHILSETPSDFRALKYENGIVYPLLCNQYRDKLCYIMEKISTN